MPFWMVEEAMQEAKAIAWDKCHKIYLLMDDEQVELTKSYGYDPLLLASDYTQAQLVRTVGEWYESSCSLRFVEAVSTNKSDPNAGFITLIAQFEDEEEEEEE